MPAPHPPFTAEHEELRLRARDVVAEQLAPHADAWEEERWFPDAVFASLGAQGWLGLKYPRAWGGSERGHLADAVWAEELARCGSGGVAAGIGAHTSIATPPVFAFGTDALRERYLAPAIRGELVAALAITEPDAGSDVAGLRTAAERVDGGWLVRGRKTYITNGVRADFYVAAVRTRPEGGHHGISFLLVERGEGVSATKLEKLGWHASDTGEVAFDEVFVPAERLLGTLHEGFRLIMGNFQWERLLMALGAVGAMDWALERTVGELGGGAGGGGAVHGQATRHAVAAAQTTLATGRALTYEALRRFAAGGDAVQQVTMAKLATQRAAVDVIGTCLDLTGDPALERALRDARLGPIGGGTDEVMKEILGRTLGL